MDHLFLWMAAALLLLGGLLEGVPSWRYLQGLRRDHPQTWRHGGERTIWTDGSLLAARPTIRYLRDRRYLASGDPAGIEFCERHRDAVLRGYWAGWILFPAALIALLVDVAR